MKHILLNGIPKAGCHLLERIAPVFDYVVYPWTAFDKIKKDSELFQFWVHHHMQYSIDNESILRKRNFKKVFIIRDLRDVVASLYRAVMLEVDDWHAGFKKQFVEWGKEETISRIILDRGNSDCKIINDRVKFAEFDKKWLSWMNIDFCMSVKFEELIGRRGGGDDAKQLDIFKQILKFIEFPAWHAEIELKVKELFSTESTTYAEGGKIGVWKEHFTKRNIEEFKMVAGTLLQSMGYEGEDWC